MELTITSILFPAFAAAVTAGGAAYGKSCKSCHGAAGMANPANPKKFPVIPDLTSARVQEKTDVEPAKVITGGKGMRKPAKALTSTPDDVVASVRTLKK